MGADDFDAVHGASGFMRCEDANGELRGMAGEVADAELEAEGEDTGAFGAVRRGVDVGLGRDVDGEPCVERQTSS